MKTQEMLRLAAYWLNEWAVFLADDGNNEDQMFLEKKMTFETELRKWRDKPINEFEAYEIGYFMHHKLKEMTKTK
jgi:hypothetical protein